MKKIYFFCLAAALLFCTGLMAQTGLTFFEPIQAGTIQPGTSYSRIQVNEDFNLAPEWYAGDYVYYSFSIETPASVTISTCGSSLDTELALYNSEEELIYSNDDNGPSCSGAKASIQVYLLAGTYIVRSVPDFYYNGSGAVETAISVSSYTVGANTIAPISAGVYGHCAGGTFSDTKSNAAANNFLNDTGQPSDDIYYFFTIASYSEVRISHEGSSIDTYLHLLDQNGAVLAINDNNGPLISGAAASIRQFLQPGTYYIVSEGTGNLTGNIITSVAITSAEGVPGGAQLSNAINAGTISPGNPYSNVAFLTDCYGDDTGDYGNDIFYKFTLEERSNISLSHCWGSRGFNSMYLLDVNGNELARAEHTGPVCSFAFSGYNASIKTVLGPGTYYLVSKEQLPFSHEGIKTSIFAECILLPSSLSSDQNYIATYTPRTPLSDANSLSSKGICEVSQTVQYFDGLGRLLQQVQSAASPQGKDIIQPVAYDELGRESRKYLPYTDEFVSGSFRNTALSAQAAFYNSSGANSIVKIEPANGITPSFAETKFEASPLARVLEQGAPGAAWQLGAGHELKNEFGTNAVNEVRLWEVTSSGASGSGFYASNELYKSVFKDENGNKTIEFKDKAGRVVLKQAEESSSIYLNIYYVYDDLGNLRYVIPPNAVITAVDENSAVFKQLIYGYAYDNKNRLIRKKIPGKGWEEIIYNSLDQAVFTQDAVQRETAAPGPYRSFVKYDGLSRIIMTGVEKNHAGSREDIQNYINTLTVFWEGRDASGSHGYTNNSVPKNLQTIEVLSVNYYDSYTGIPNLPFSPSANCSIKTRGLLTASKVKVLGSDTYLWSLYSYDDEGRVIQTQSQNHIGGTELVSNIWSFSGELLKTVRTHSSTSVPALVIENEYTYDAAGRKKESWQKIGAGLKTQVSYLEYNELGQLWKKKLGVKDSGAGSSEAVITLSTADIVQVKQQRIVSASKSITLLPGFEVKKGGNFTGKIGGNALQVIEYAYNERGWLKQINDPDNLNAENSFGMKLLYNTHTDASKRQYNGNISAITWQTKVPEGLNLVQKVQGYDYSYDKLNRLTLADYTAAGAEGKYNEALSYDAAGNISTLKRTSGSTSSYLNNLTYTYIENGEASNRLASAADAGTAANTSTYSYDANGNMASDSKKGITLGYNYLNLPELVKKNSDELRYIYTASGAKLSKVYNNTDKRDYAGGIEYFNGAIEFIQTEEGRAVPSGGKYVYEYMLKDHLGNTRAALSEGRRMIQVQDYYAFGMEMNTGNSTSPSPGNNYKYNGKELQKELGLEQYDYGARFYDPVIARWNTIDPLAELGRRWSPYTYCFNNPIVFTDPDGMWGDFINGDGKVIGNDGKDDGRAYVIKTTQKKFDSGAPSAGITKDHAKATEKFISDNSGNTAAFDANSIAYNNSVEITGAPSTRQSMVDIVNQDNGTGGTSDANNREYGGVIKTDGTVTQSPPGPVANPLTDPKAHIDITKFDFQSSFHSHPSGNIYSAPGSNTIGGSTTSASFNNAPSNVDGDIQNSGNRVNYVFARGTGTVYIYNNAGVQAAIPQKYFVTPKK